MRLIDADALIADIKECIEAKYDNYECKQAEGLKVALSCVDDAPTIEPPKKDLYRFYNDGQYVKILLLTDDQAAVFYWLENLGVPIILEPNDGREPEEIRPEDLMKKENN